MLKRKRWFEMAVLLLACALAASGCAAPTVIKIGGGRFDSTVSPSEESVLVIGENNWPTVITRFDGEPVQWNAKATPPHSRRRYVYTIRIPAGIHLLTGVAVGFSSKETSARYEFIAGKEYRVAVINGNVRIAEAGKYNPAFDPPQNDSAHARSLP
jgi:hypothetical protein